MRSTPSRAELLQLAARVDPRYRAVWDGLPQGHRAALAAYLLPHRSRQQQLRPTRPRVVKWYCPFASQERFPSGHRYCINVYTGCAHGCVYCYAASYEPERAASKPNFRRLIERDMADLEAFDVPAAPVHLSNSVDPFQPLERRYGHTRYALEKILAHRHRFTTVTLLTKNPLAAAQSGCLELLRELNQLPSDHPRASEFRDRRLPALQVHVSLAFWNDRARAAYERAAPSVAERREGIRALREAGIPVVLRIDPLFPRSPLPTRPPSRLEDFGLAEAQTLEELENLVAFAARSGVRHVVYSVLKVVPPRRRKAPPEVQALRAVYQATCAPDKPPWRGGSWRLPRHVAARYIAADFLRVCRHRGVQARFCMADLLETP